MQLTLWPLLTRALGVCPPSGHNLRCHLTQGKKYEGSEASQACPVLPSEAITLRWQCPHDHCVFFPVFVIVRGLRVWRQISTNHHKKDIVSSFDNLCRGPLCCGLVLITRPLRTENLTCCPPINRHFTVFGKMISDWMEARPLQVSAALLFYCVTLLCVAGTGLGSTAHILKATSAVAAGRLRHCNPCDCKPWRVASQETSQQITSNLATRQLSELRPRRRKTVVCCCCLLLSLRTTLLCGTWKVVFHSTVTPSRHAWSELVFATE